MIRSSSDQDFFTWTYQTYKPILVVDTDDIVMAAQNRVCFERFTQ